MMIAAQTGCSACKAISRRSVARIFLVLTIMAGVGTPCLFPTIAAAESGSSLESKIRTLKERLTTGKRKAKGLQSKLEQIETKRARVTANLREQERLYQVHNDRLTALEQRRDALRSELMHHRTSLVQQVRTAFTIGRQEKLKLLLNQSNPAVVGRTLVYYDYFNENRARRIVAAQTSLEELESVESQLKRELASLQKTLHALRKEKAAVDETRAERTRILEELQGELLTGQDELERLIEDQRRLQGVVDEVASKSDSEPTVAARPPSKRNPSVSGRGGGADKPFGQMRGSLRWPTAGTLRGRFGRPREPGSNLRWQGVYIAAKSGGEVRAVSSGRVAFAAWIRGFGLMVILDHGGGYMSLYGHNQTVFRKPDERVRAGDVIATVGDSGGQHGPGLYFEIRRQGRPQNPEDWCARDSNLVRLE